MLVSKPMITLTTTLDGTKCPTYIDVNSIEKIIHQEKGSMITTKSNEITYVKEPAHKVIYLINETIDRVNKQIYERLTEGLADAVTIGIDNSRI